MKIPVSLLTFALVVGCFAQTPAGTPDQELTEILPGILIPAELSKSLDAKKAKPGDKIELKTTMDMLSQGKIVIPRNSKIEGHVTSAKPHTKESPGSELGMAFDRIFIKNGRELRLQASIQAIAPPIIINIDAPGSPVPIGSAPPGQQSNNVGGTEAPHTALGGAGQYPSMAAPKVATPTVPGSLLTSQSHGAIGMKGTDISSTKGANVISSSKQNVRLDGETQFMLRTE